MNYQSSKKRTYEILEYSVPNDKIAKTFSIALITFITINVIVVIFETEEALYHEYEAFFAQFEFISITIFTIEYILRLWSCTINDRYNRPLQGRIRYFFEPLSILDLLAIMPFYLPLLFPIELILLRILRLLRVFHFFDLDRFTASFDTISRVLRNRKEPLIITLFLMFIFLILSSSIMYLCEKNAQPEHFSSIPQAMWWGVITLTNVGYGDVYPITPIGQFLGGIVAFLGVIVVGLLSGIIGSGFMEEINRRHQSEKSINCPHCGKEINTIIEK
jgi:voltage-gated potassium channel